MKSSNVTAVVADALPAPRDPLACGEDAAAGAARCPALFSALVIPDISVRGTKARA
jgi:hypothetical protein